MPNPLVVIRDLIAVDAANLPAGTTRGTSFPVGAISVPHVQYAWDGTPSDADNRENAAIRVTVWTPAGQTTTAQDIALGLRKRLLNASHVDAWRIDRGAGRLPGIDPDTGLPFCTFSLTVALHAPA